MTRFELGGREDGAGEGLSALEDSFWVLRFSLGSVRMK